MSILEIIKHAGINLYVLLACSFTVWAVILERLWKYRRLTEDLNRFHLNALNLLLRGEKTSLIKLCHDDSRLPTARLVALALERIAAKDPRISSRWHEALERKRSM